MSTATTTARDALTALAHQQLSFVWMDVSDQVAALSPLPDYERQEAFSELCQRVSDLGRFQRGETDWSDVVPDAEGTERDEQALDALTTFVELALDRVTGGE